MIRKTVFLFVFLLSIAMFADPNDPANPPQFQAPPQGNFQNQPMDNNAFQPPQHEQQVDQMKVIEDNSDSSDSQKILKPGDTVCDLNTTHGSIIIKKLPPKPAATASDTNKKADIPPAAQANLDTPIKNK